MFSWRSNVLVVFALVVGAVFGLLPPLLLAVGGSGGSVANLVLAAGWAWAALAFCVGLAGKSKRQAAVLAGLSLVAAVIAYYVTKLAQGGFLTADLRDTTGRTVDIDWSGFFSNTVVWCIAAVLLGPLLGLAGSLAHSRGLRGLAFKVVVPLIAIIDTSMRLHFENALQGSVATTTWSVIRLVAATAIIVLIGHAMVIAWRSQPTVDSDA